MNKLWTRKNKYISGHVYFSIHKSLPTAHKLIEIEFRRVSFENMLLDLIVIAQLPFIRSNRLGKIYRIAYKYFRYEI